MVSLRFQWIPLCRYLVSAVILPAAGCLRSLGVVLGLEPEDDCVEGSHDGGDGDCMPEGSCLDGYRLVGDDVLVIAL